MTSIIATASGQKSPSFSFASFNSLNILITILLCDTSPPEKKKLNHHLENLKSSNPPPQSLGESHWAVQPSISSFPFRITCRWHLARCLTRVTPWDPSFIHACAHLHEGATVRDQELFRPPTPLFLCFVLFIWVLVYFVGSICFRGHPSCGETS